MATIEWHAAQYTQRFGMHLVPLKPKGKGPLWFDWGNKAITDPDAAANYWRENPTHNMGLALGPSGYCSLDIDCWESFVTAMQYLGAPYEELQSYPTIRGADKGLRVLFKMPEGADLEYHKLNWHSRNDPTGDIHRAKMRQAMEAKKADDKELEKSIRLDAKQYASYTVIELRTAKDQQRHDVLPPSIHPDTGRPYEWIVRPRQPWPEPPAWLLSIWTAWNRFEPQLKDACPWHPQSPPKSAPRAKSGTQGNSQSGAAAVIEAYCNAHPLESVLMEYGYTQVGSRYLSPHSGTKLAGVNILDDKTCWIHHASDPLCSVESGQPVNAFDLYRYYEHGGDVGKAVAAAERELGIVRPRQTEQPRQAARVEQTEQTEQPRQAPTGHFTALGYSGSSYYYLPRATEQVAQIRRDSHTNSSSLMALAPLEWWEHVYPKERGGADWQLAASDLMRQCEARGLYDQELERGRGAWYDRGRSVLHLGDKLLVDGQEMAISDLDSSYIYTRLPHMDSSVSAAPASDEQSSAVVGLIDQLNWTKPEHSRFLAGWIALAPICGALRWRPHVWLTAQRGAGKSWVQDRIIYPMLGRSAIHVQGATTEAGIRQRLKQDGRPVIFDEAEPGAGRGKDRIQGVIILARQASSDSGAEIIKGTTDGAGMAFRARSMFLMGSINVGLHEAADESRFTVLSLEEPSGSAQAQQRFRQYASEVDRMMTKELCASVRARIYKMIPTIRENANLLAAAVAEQLGSQRMGDQVGTLLAGWNAMLSTELLCMEEARGIVASMDWDDAEQQKTVSDEENLLAAIMQAQVRFDADGRSHTRSIGELIECAAGRVAGCGDTSPLEANAALGRHGLRVDGPTLYVANAHKELQRALDHTPWAAGWHTILRRLPGAGPCKTGVRMGGVLSRVTSIPLESVL